MARYLTEAAYRQAIRFRITEAGERSGWQPGQITKVFAAKRLAIGSEKYLKLNTEFGISHEDVQNLRIR